MGELAWKTVIGWLESAGIPVTISGVMVWFMWLLDRRQSAREAASLADNSRLSQDENNFRAQILSETTNLREHVKALYLELSNCRKHHEECVIALNKLRIQIDALVEKGN